MKAFHWPLLALGAALFLSIGFISGRMSAAPPEQAVASRETTATRRSPVTREENHNRDSFEKRWRILSVKPAGAVREKAMADLLRERAVHDPEGALALANAETNLRIRRALVTATLCGWATVDPAASSSWAAENLADEERKSALEGIIESGMACRDETLRAIGELCKKDPVLAFDAGHAMIESLGRNGDFDLAVKFATEGTGDNRNYWMSSAFLSWAQYRPEEAVAALGKITDPSASNEALHGLVYGWASNEPAALVKFAQQLPPGDVRKTAMNEGLQHWVNSDPAAASAWLDSRDPGEDLDGGAAKLATNSQLVASDPDAALGRANGIFDPQQRVQALTDIIFQWSKQDPGAAKRYAENSPDFQPEGLSKLLSEIDAAATR